MAHAKASRARAPRAGGGAVVVDPNDPPEHEAFDMSADGQKRRWAMVVALFVAFVLCNLDKVNMSVAIVPMAKELGWSTTQKGLVGTWIGERRSRAFGFDRFRGDARALFRDHAVVTRVLSEAY